MAFDKHDILYRPHQRNDQKCLIVRFLTGHAFLRRQNAIVDQGINPPLGDVSCRMCEDPVMDETPHHLITECDALCSWRASTLYQYTMDEVPE